MYVYADIVIIINIAMNGIILVLTAWVAGINYKVWRILTASALGAVYALGGVAAELELLYTPLAKLAVAAALVYAAFGSRSGRLLAKAVACFYLVSFVLGGAVTGWLYYFQVGTLVNTGREAWLSLSWQQLLAGTAVAVLLSVFALRRLAANLIRRRALLPVIVSYGGRQARLLSLLDTGNQLFTAVGRKPVVLVEAKALEPVLSEAVNGFLHSNQPELWLANLQQCCDQSWLGRIQPIPYQAVGNRSLLLGFRPDSLTVLTPAARVETDAVVIGIYSGRLSPDGSYNALLHPMLVQLVNVKEGANICA